jgi:DNA-binding MarR family transcriptional regulator
MTDADALPPSAKFVLDVLERADDRELSRMEIIEYTGLPERTVDDALDTLEKCDCILRSRKSEDLRQVVCKIHDYPDI